MHTLLLIWKHSAHYNVAPRFVTLVLEICHDLIMQACKFVPGPELIQMEPGEAVEKLRLAIRVLANFKQFYFEYRSKSLVEALQEDTEAARAWWMQCKSLPPDITMTLYFGIGTIVNSGTWR